MNNNWAMIKSITFDGASVNLKMCLIYPSENFKPFFLNPFTNRKMFIFWDVCHMVKFVRNTLDDTKNLTDSEDKLMKCEFFEKLLHIQENEG